MSHTVGRALVLIGLIVLIVAAIFLVVSLISIKVVYGASLARGIANPGYKVAITTVLALVAGILLGLGLAYGSRRVRREVTGPGDLPRP